MAPFKKTSSNQKKAGFGSRRDKKLAIPKPTLKNARSGIAKTSENRVRSMEKRLENELRRARVRAQKFKEFAQVIRVPYTLESLNKNLSKEVLNGICEKDLGSDQESQCVSAQFVDRDGQPILFYFGNRIITDGEGPPEEIELKDQYRNRTDAYWDSIQNTDTTYKVFDGLHRDKCEVYHIATQNLVKDLPLHQRNDQTRHGGFNVMNYTKEGVDGPPTAEHAGVVHLVHCWPMQAQKKKGLYISGDISDRSTSLAEVGSYYCATQGIAIALAAMFEATFPDLYQEYREAFEAGVWFQEDPGPFIGRAIIYKLQSKVHKDKNDIGPSASFPVGYFEGGEMLFPQLGTKLKYGPGCVCLFYSSILYHKVSTFLPKPQTVAQQEENITPGRIGSVFFFHKDSFDILKGKPKNWGKETNFGRNENLLDNHSRSR